MNRHLQRTASVLVMTLLLGCAAPPDAGFSATVVRIKGESIPYREFVAYLESSLGEETPPPDDFETRSQLLDQFIEERLLLQEAEKRKIMVSEQDVEAQLERLGMADDSGRVADPQLRERVLENLIIEAFKERVLLRDIHITPERVEDYYRDHLEEFREARAVVLRQILVEEESEAREIRALLEERPEEFSALAERHSIAPDRGNVRSFREEELPEPIREAVFALPPGRVTEILDEGARYRILQVVEHYEVKQRQLEEVRERIGVLLFRQEVERKLEEEVTHLRQSSRIQILQKNLPFRYVGVHQR